MDTYKNIVLLIGIGSFIIYDLAVDAFDHVEKISSHVYMEALILIGILFLIARHVITINKLKRSLETEQVRVEKLTGELTSHIQKQFDDWNLSASEQEVAWLMIKGFSFADIATVRSVKEKTIRQQATNIYAKTETNNRSEFSAWFVEDLFRPGTKIEDKLAATELK